MLDALQSVCWRTCARTHVHRIPLARILVWGGGARHFTSLGRASAPGQKNRLSTKVTVNSHFVPLANQRVQGFLLLLLFVVN